MYYDVPLGYFHKYCSCIDYNKRLCNLQVTGSKAPQLKRLGQWLIENPIFDVDPKWAELVKERGNLPHDLHKRVPGSERSNSKGKSPGRPPMMPSPTSQASSNPSNMTATSIASQLNFPGLSNSLLSTLSMGNFDPKNNPLLMPFGSLPNLGALGSLGNISNMNLTNSFFANLAGLGLPSLTGMESVLGGSTPTSSTETNTATSSLKNVGSIMSSNSSTSNTTKSRAKVDLATSKALTPSTSSSSSLPTTTPFPFFFPNPSLLYTPLGLGSLNPFSIQPGGVSSAYESLAQCALLNSSASNASPSRKSNVSMSSSRQKDFSVDSSSKKKDSDKKTGSSSTSGFRYPIDSTLMLQQYADFTLHSDDKKRADSEKKEVIDLNDITDLSARFEKKTKEQEIKGSLEQLSKANAELLSRGQHIEELHRSQKRSRASDNPITDQQVPSSLEVTLEPVQKKSRVFESEGSNLTSINEYNVELETVMKPLSIVKKSQTPNLTLQATPSSIGSTTPIPSSTLTSSSEQLHELPQEESNNKSLNASNDNKESTNSTSSHDLDQQEKIKSDNNRSSSFVEPEEDVKSMKTINKKSRGGKKVLIDQPIERKNLRSSAGRQARAAAERQAKMEGEQLPPDQESQQSEN